MISHRYCLYFICKRFSETGKPTAVKQRIEETKSQLEKAEEYRLIGNNEFRNQDYPKSIDAYTNSIRCDSNNAVVYMNRALACTSSTAWYTSILSYRFDFRLQNQ